MKTKLFILLIVFMMASVISADAKTICFCAEYSGFEDQSGTERYLLVVIDEKDKRVYELEHPAVCIDTDYNGLVLALNEGKDEPHTGLYHWADQKLYPFSQFGSFDCDISGIVCFRNHRAYYIRNDSLFYRTSTETIPIPLPQNMKDPYSFQCAVSPHGNIVVSDRKDLWITLDEGHSWRLVPRTADDPKNIQRISFPLGWLDDCTLLYFTEYASGYTYTCQLFQYSINGSESSPYLTNTAEPVVLKDKGIYGRMVVSKKHISFVTDTTGYVFESPGGQDVVTEINLKTGETLFHDSLEEYISGLVDYDFCNYAGFYLACVVIR